MPHKTTRTFGKISVWKYVPEKRVKLFYCTHTPGKLHLHVGRRFGLIMIKHVHVYQVMHYLKAYNPKYAPKTQF